MTREIRPSKLTSASDEELMTQVMEDSQEAFAVLVDRYSQRVIHTVYRYISDRARSEDIAQEVFLRLWIHRLRYRPGGRFSAWLFTIAVNLAKNEVRSRMRHRRTTSLELLQETGMDTDPGLVDRERQPDMWAEQAQLQVAVSEAVQELPEAYREAVVMRDLDGLSYEEISEVLGVPGGTVRSRINRARHLLKKKLLPYLTGE